MLVVLLAIFVVDTKIIFQHDFVAPLMSCYRTLKQTSSELLFNEINRLSNKYKYNPIWIGGDFSLHDIDWETKSITGSQYPKIINESFHETLDLCNSDQLVNFTRRKNHTLDLLITNWQAL